MRFDGGLLRRTVGGDGGRRWALRSRKSVRVPRWKMRCALFPSRIGGRARLSRAKPVWVTGAALCRGGHVISVRSGDLPGNIFSVLQRPFNPNHASAASISAGL